MRAMIKVLALCQASVWLQNGTSSNSTNSCTPFLFSALHPPVPPAFCPAFSSIVRLLCCDIFIHVLRRVLQRAAEDRLTHWTEAMIQRVRTTFVDALIFTWFW